MRIASVADVKANFSAYVKESERGAVVVTRNGRPVAVLLEVQDEDEIERLIMSHSPRLRAILDAAHERIKAGQGIKHEDFWKQVDAEYADPAPGPADAEPKKSRRSRVA